MCTCVVAAGACTTPPAESGEPDVGSVRDPERLVAILDDAGRPVFQSLDGSGRLPTGWVVAVSRSAQASAGAVSSDPRVGEQWGLGRVGAMSAWTVNSGEGVVVAVLDSGVDGSHPDLEGQVLSGFDPIGGGDGWFDPNGHGTHVAGVIAALRDNDVGGVGLAPAVKVLPVRVLDANGVGDHEDIASGVVWATSQGADVINMSLGGAETSEVLEVAVRYALDAGVVVVAAAGNSRFNGNLVSYPAAYSGVIGVAAAGPDGRSAIFSNTGDYIDVAAPGFGVLSTFPGGEFANLSGTSQAAPFVAAAAAMLLASGVAPSAVESTLEAAASTSPSPRDEVGAGMLDVGFALTGQRAPTSPILQTPMLADFEMPGLNTDGLGDMFDPTGGFPDLPDFAVVNPDGGWPLIPTLPQPPPVVDPLEPPMAPLPGGAPVVDPLFPTLPPVPSLPGVPGVDDPPYPTRPPTFDVPPATLPALPVEPVEAGGDGGGPVNVPFDPLGSLSKVNVTVPAAAVGERIEVRVSAISVEVADVVTPSGEVVALQPGAVRGSFTAEITSGRGDVVVRDATGAAVASQEMTPSPGVRVVTQRRYGTGVRLTLSVAPLTPVLVRAQHVEGGVWVTSQMAVASDGFATIDVKSATFRLLADAAGFTSFIGNPQLMR